MPGPEPKLAEQTGIYIEQMAPLAQLAANALGVPTACILGAVANEYDIRFHPELSLNGRYGTAADRFFTYRDHAWLARSYEDLKASKGEDPGSPAQRFNPAAIAVGPGNIRIETAIDLLKEHLEAHSTKRRTRSIFVNTGMTTQS